MSPLLSPESARRGWPVRTLLLVLLPCLLAGEKTKSPPTLADASLEDLMAVEVTSVARRRQPLSKSAAAVYVISQDDIRRSGATSVPEALRMVPGLFVGRIDSNKWAISARGEAGRFSNKMLVLIDGRTVYTSLYSGVYWDQNDVMMEDIERIEVIRGPGGTLWGANAVNAVINIITKSAQATQGLLASTTAGSEDRVVGALRYGGKAGEKLHYRVFSKYLNRSQLKQVDGAGAGDGWDAGRAGARLEWQPDEINTLTVHGDIYRGRADEYVDPSFILKGFSPAVYSRVDNGGGYALGRWERSLSERSDMALQTYVHVENRDEGFGSLRNRVVDFDFQHHLAVKSRHDLLWGAGYRVTGDSILSGPLLHSASPFMPASRTDSLLGAFLQDDIAIVPDKFVITAGSKLQRNPYTGVEYQPSLRMLWSPTPRHSLWASVSRAVRTPSRRDRDLRLDIALPAPFPPGSIIILNGNAKFSSEALRSYETGWRWQPRARFGLDVAGFYGQYKNLQSIVQGEPEFALAPVFKLRIPVTFGNGNARDNAGMEVASYFQARARWRLHVNYTRYWQKEWAPGQQMLYSLSRAWPFPAHMGQFRSAWDIKRRWSFDVSLYAVSRLAGVDVPGYLRSDVRLAYRSGEVAEWSFGLQDALRERRVEFRSEDYVQNSEPGRRFYVKLVWGH
jgi:iron complex outermembrane recepter protein